MTWKLEKWKDGIFDTKAKKEALAALQQQYESMGLREVIIVMCAELDVALAELICMRLRGDEKEKHEFLGADLDGRAPAGSFGARIQLAYLLDIISKSDLILIRKCKLLRNHMSHRVKAGISDNVVKKMAVQIGEAFIDKMESDFEIAFKGVKKQFFATLENVNGLKSMLLAVMAILRIQFDARHEQMEQISALHPSTKKK